MSLGNRIRTTRRFRLRAQGLALVCLRSRLHRLALFRPSAQRLSLRRPVVVEPRAEQRRPVGEAELRDQLVEVFDFLFGQSKPHVTRRGFFETGGSSHCVGFT